jgi:hypothetical protein
VTTRVRVFEWLFAWVIMAVLVVWRLVTRYDATVLEGCGIVVLCAAVSFRFGGAVLIAWSDYETVRRLAATERAKQEASSDAEP